MLRPPMLMSVTEEGPPSIAPFVCICRDHRIGAF